MGLFARRLLAHLLRASLLLAQSSDALSHLRHGAKNQSVGPGPSLFCFMVARPQTFEVELVKLHSEHCMLTGCDKHLVFSNVTMQELLNIHVSEAAPSDGKRPVLHGSLDVGTECFPSDTCLQRNVRNSPVFAQVWKHIHETGVYRDYDWTVKVDPDTVFLPGRLRQLLQHRPHKGAVVLGNSDGFEGCYGHTCLAGAILVLSQQAVPILASRWEECYARGAEKEDTLVLLCMRRFAKLVPEPYLLGTLMRQQCCGDRFCGWKVAAHGHKSPEAMLHCLSWFQRGTRAGDLWMDGMPSGGVDGKPPAALPRGSLCDWDAGHLPVAMWTGSPSG